MSTPGAALHTPAVEPPRWLWLWLPLILFILVLLAVLRVDSDPAYVDRWWLDYFMWVGWRSSTIEEESGFIELATPPFLALAIIAGICALRHRHRLPTKWIRGWVALVTMACVYILGEELAWGQYIFGWNPPEWWPSPETNIHSISEVDVESFWWASFFNEKPRLLLELFVLYGGIIRVLWLRDVKEDDWRDWFWPSPICLPAAILAILARLPDRLDYQLGFGYATLVFDHNMVSWKSFQELFFAIFLALYLASIRYRVTALNCLLNKRGTSHASTDTSGSRTSRTDTVGRQLHTQRNHNGQTNHKHRSDNAGSRSNRHVYRDCQRAWAFKSTGAQHRKERGCQDSARSRTEGTSRTGRA